MWLNAVSRSNWLGLSLSGPEKGVRPCSIPEYSTYIPSTFLFTLGIIIIDNKQPEDHSSVYFCDWCFQALQVSASPYRMPSTVHVLQSIVLAWLDFAVTFPEEAAEGLPETIGFSFNSRLEGQKLRIYSRFRRASLCTSDRLLCGVPFNKMKAQDKMLSFLRMTTLINSP